MSRPVFHGLVRLRVAAGLRRAGHGVIEARELSHALTGDVIDAHMGPESTKAIGDGTIINAIMEFLASPAGQALIDALIKLLIGML